MDDKAGAQISRKSFIQSFFILFCFIILAGFLTRIIPSGLYNRYQFDRRELIDPASFQYTPKPDYPFWRWFSAPIEVLWGPDSLTIITIIVFLLFVGISFAVLDKCGILSSLINTLVRKFSHKKYLLLMVVSLFFMSIGAFFGIFEEVVPLVPLIVMLAYSLGWDSLVGLGMSILATNMGFSAAISNPFTIGVAQQIAGLPLFSGSWFRFIIFTIIYLLFSIFLVNYARRIERDPTKSEVYSEDQEFLSKKTINIEESFRDKNEKFSSALNWLFVFLILIILTLISPPFVPGISDYSLPIVGILFLIAGIGAGFLSSYPNKIFSAIKEGALGITPAIPLILMAVSIKHIISQGGIIDTILYSVSGLFIGITPFIAILLVYFVALVIEIFVPSGSAKAFLLMPLLLPLSDLIGITRQTTVTAYCFGDGFSNLAYPTNPVLLISLGLTVVSYNKWLKWSLKLWLWVILATLMFLFIATTINYGPF